MSASAAERRWRWTIRLIAAAGVWSLGLVLAALLLRTSDGETTVDGVATLTQQTVVQNRGLWALGVVLIPLAASAVVAVAVVHRRRRDARWAVPAAAAAIAVLVAAAVLTITSVGAFMVPVCLLLVAALRLAPGWGDVRARPVADA